MLTLLRERQEQVRAFIMEQARPLERALYRYYFEDGPREAVLAALSDFQNEDGGFGHGLEPDIRLPGSSALCTTVGLQKLREMKVRADHPLVQGAIRYLLASMHADHRAWLPVPPNVSEAPHAPWWSYQPDPAVRLHNPRPEIAGYFVQYAELVPAEVRAPLVESVIAHLEATPDKDWESGHDDLLCYVRLVESPELAAEHQARLKRKLAVALRLTVSTDPAAWDGYVMKPLKLVTRPDRLFAGDFAEAVQVQLDREIAAQGEDGAWHPYWAWPADDATAWPTAEREWKGWLTLDMLLVLRAFGRLA